jgi:pyruvate formate lyase activating enzyme
VLDFIKLANKTGVHAEITTLVVPGLNDTEEELADIADFIASLNGEDANPPWHLTAYHPDYRWNAPPTDRAFLMRMADEARKKLRYVHTGNI